MENENYKIRVSRKKTRFYVDNEILENYAHILKPFGIAIYCVLARHANNKTQSCFPSYEKIMKSSGIGRRNTVTKNLKLLEKLGLIVIKTSNGYTSNHYWLLNVKSNTQISSSYAIKQYPERTHNSIERDTVNLSIESTKEIITPSKKETPDPNTEYRRNKFKEAKENFYASFGKIK
jgi:DNA-binding HxlR family transcriptional regulator